MNAPELPPKGMTKKGRKFAEECLAYAKAITPVAGAGIHIRQLTNGTQINAAAEGGVSGTPVPTYFIRNGVLVLLNVLTSGAVTTVG